MKYLLLFISTSLLAKFIDLKENDFYQYKKSSSKTSFQKRKKKNKNPLDKKLNALLKKDQEITEILEKYEKSPIIKKQTQKVAALSRYKGTLLNSVIATDVKPAKFIVRIDSGPLKKAELRCLGHSFQQRVPSRCDLLVLKNVSYDVDVEIWDLDGAEGMIADKYYSGEEKEFLSASFASFFQGVTELGQSKVKNPRGKDFLSSLKAIPRNAGKKISDSGGHKVSLSFVNSGKRVIVFFNQKI